MFNICTKQYLRYLCYKCGIQRTAHSGYDDLSCNFKIISLHNRFRLLDLKFVFKLLHNHINYFEFVECFNFKINVFNSRNTPVFYLLNATNTYKIYSPANN